MGWLIVERGDGPLSLSIRKSFFFRGPGVQDNYAAAMRLLEADGKKLDKMKVVAELLKK